MKFLLRLLKASKLKRLSFVSYRQAFFHVLWSLDSQLINSGFFVGMFGALYKLFNCIQRYNLADSESKFIPAVSAFLATLLLAPSCLNKP